jgi:hypothetical protein
MGTSSSPEPQQAVGGTLSQSRDRLEDCDDVQFGWFIYANKASHRAPDGESKSTVSNLDLGSEPLTQSQPDSSDGDSSDEDDMLQNGFSDPSNGEN